ncbi:hypothetical protein J5N97_004034 [Dioscorea zingiberensis]|uniref:Uncharacterized protein n=1 Tax=Dioscorea zingiberensis TaxID=325984 RepID=A0A9D5D5U6_9LILI|nr:hypothetical protein J5N97_004034 [Dioscorea zingiberensis]
MNHVFEMKHFRASFQIHFHMARLITRIHTRHHPTAPPPILLLLFLSIWTYMPYPSASSWSGARGTQQSRVPEAKH